MQHLRPVGLQEDGVESILLEAPSLSKGKAKTREPIDLIKLPEEALPSITEVPRNYETQQAIPSSIAGFQPDMDPHLRQVLEALEDDAFVEDDLADDFFGELVVDGERGDEDVKFEFRDEGAEGEEDDEFDDGAQGEEEEGWEAMFAKFKKVQTAAGVPSEGSDLDFHSEGEDTVGTLPQFSVIGGKKRRKGSSDASGYSMSSSSMFRNQGLTTLDERFDQVRCIINGDQKYILMILSRFKRSTNQMRTAKTRSPIQTLRRSLSPLAKISTP